MAVMGTSSFLSGQQVVGCFGQMTMIGSGVHISSTAGETIVSTEASHSYQLTQGFHQPLAMSLLHFEVEVVNASCETSTDGGAKVTNIVGCRAPYQILWSFGDTGTKVGRLAPGTYAVTVSSGECMLTKSFTIGAASEDACKIVFFKAFSPNGDGKNDGWFIENIQRPEFSDNRVEVFNRWGQRIWEGQGYDNETVMWMGKTQGGGTLPDGTYFFVARIGEVLHKGYVELTR
jgi:gliding motility-associated-like protein